MSASSRGRARLLPLAFALDGSIPAETTFDEFVRINRVSDADAEAIARKLVDDGVFVGGGGAVTRYTLSVLKPPRTSS